MQLGQFWLVSRVWARPTCLWECLAVKKPVALTALTSAREDIFLGRIFWAGPLNFKVPPAEVGHFESSCLNIKHLMGGGVIIESLAF